MLSAAVEIIMKVTNITIAGAVKGQVASIGNILIDAALFQGCAVFAWCEDGSEGLGAKNYYHIRVSETPVNRQFFQADILVETTPAGKWSVSVLDDTDSSSMKPLLSNDRVESHPTIGAAFADAALLGAVCALAGLDFYTLVQYLARHFGQTGKKEISRLQTAAYKGYSITADKTKNIGKDELPVKSQRYVGFTGNDAIALGAAFVGCRFIGSYLMTPSDRVVTLLQHPKSRYEKFSQPIKYSTFPAGSAATETLKNHKGRAIGQPYGFEWASENIFSPGFADTPIVIVFGQRREPGCSKCVRARIDEHLFSVCTKSNKPNRLLLTPKNAEDAFYKTILAFRLADIYHAPVIILTDPMLAESLFSVGELDPTQQSLFEYLSNPEKIKCHMPDESISRSSRFHFNDSSRLGETGQFQRSAC